MMEWFVEHWILGLALIFVAICVPLPFFVIIALDIRDDRRLKKEKNKESPISNAT